MFRNTVVIIIATLILSGCSGGVSGIMSSSGFGHWQIYIVSSQPENGNKLDQPIEDILEHQFVSLGFKRKYGWGSPLLTNARVATFKQKYKDRYISIDVEISHEDIILMSTSYSSYTKKVFNNIEAVLKDTFGETNIEKCYGTKDLNGHSCFQ
jgi:hypothetical protein